MKTIEYRVRPVTRYIVTRYHSENDEDTGLSGGGVETIGEFQNSQQANRVAVALSKDEGAEYSACLES